MDKPMPPKPPGSDDEFVMPNAKRGSIRLSREDRENREVFDWSGIDNAFERSVIYTRPR